MTGEELVAEYAGGRRDFRGEDLRGIDLGGATFGFNGTHESTEIDAILPCDFSRADFRHGTLSDGSFIGCSFEGANLEQADLRYAVFLGSDFRGANVRGAHLGGAAFRLSRLTDADLSSCNATATTFFSARFERTKFSSAIFGNTILANVDLTAAEFLDVKQLTPSAIDHLTLELTAAALTTRPYKRGEVEAFLRGCGVAQHLIEYFASMIGRPIEFYSGFISYSHADRSFARALHDALQGRGIRCWLDEHDMKPGDRILDVVNDAIRSCDKLLLCCSESSLESWWVKDEIRKALERERKEKRDLIVPVMLDDYLLNGWNDGLAAEIRSRLAANVAGWEGDHALFERGVEKIVSALRTKRP